MTIFYPSLFLYLILLNGLHIYILKNHLQFITSTSSVLSTIDYFNNIKAITIDDINGFQKIYNLFILYSIFVQQLESLCGFIFLPIISSLFFFFSCLLLLLILPPFHLSYLILLYSLSFFLHFKLFLNLSCLYRPISFPK